MTEDYVRPPVVALEAQSQFLRRWRFWALIFVLLLGLAVGIFFLAKAVIGTGEGNAQGAPHVDTNIGALAGR